MDFDEYMQLTGLEPNDVQAQAIRRADDATLLLAVPGSGKTTTLIARIGYMVKVLGVNPASILVITYTRAATATMRERYERLFGSSEGIEFRTIHGLCALILRYFEQVTGRRVFRLADGAELKGLLREIMSEVREAPPTEADINEVSTLITYHMNMLSEREDIELSDALADDFSTIYDKFRSRKTEKGIMDHDDQLCYAYRILCSHGDILRHFQDKYRYINVDEAQDTSRLQHVIIRKLVTSNVFMVGDEDQSIYAFRAAYPDALLQFRDTYENASVLLMETNYRSTPQITEFADAFIKHNRKRYDKSMHAARRDKGIEPKLIELHDFSSVYSYICSVAAKSDTETAVLYRANDSALPLVEMLERTGQEYNLLGSDTFFTSTRFGVRFLNLYKFMQNPSDDELFMRIYPALGVKMRSDSAEEAVRIHGSVRHKNLLEICADYSLVPKTYIQRMRRLAIVSRQPQNLCSYDYLKLIDRELYSGTLSQEENCSEYIRFNVMLTIASTYPDKSEFEQKLYETEDAMREHGARGAKLTLSTIHSSKGLEFDRVFLIDVKPYLMPSIMPKDWLSDDDKAVLEEDRRLYYVAATRAKNELYVFTSEHENGEFIVRSPFITESFFPHKKVEYETETPSERRQRIAERERNLRTAEKKIPIPDEKERARIRSQLKRDAVVEHTKLGRGRIITATDTVIRVRLFSDNRVLPFDIDTAVDRGYIKIVNGEDE